MRVVVCTTLPEEILDGVDQLILRGEYDTRAEVLRDAVIRLLEEKKIIVKNKMPGAYNP